MERSVSIIIPVLHESDTINELLQDLWSLEGSDGIEIIVVDGSMTRDTLTVIEDGGVTLLASDKGRGIQMNKGAGAATGEVLVFLHADTRLPRNAIEMLTRTVRSGIAAGAFSVEFVGSKNPFYRFLGVAHTLRSRITRIPFGDQAQFFSANYFRDLGGYSQEPRMEDAEIMTRVRKRGDRVEILPFRVRTSVRRFEAQGILRSLFRFVHLRTLDILGAGDEAW